MVDLKPVTAESYALVRTLIAAGGATFDAWIAADNQPLHDPWPKTDPSAKWINDQIFNYVPYMALEIHPPDLDNCQPTEESRRNATCNVTRYDVVFNSANRANLRAALDARTPPELLAEFQAVENANPRPDEVTELEWWTVLLLGGAFGAINAALVPTFGTAALVFKVAGYILAAWAAANIIIIHTPAGKGIFDKWSARLADGFNAVIDAGFSVGKILLIGLAAFVGWKIVTR
jgi:hypothetical protein